ncbi:hypothetical protein BU17DRAFT_72127 [Hysterangium stoloniferum]|nr:hypothetical protein BU17DRAFT_72127 [Hysterangium stoloniferum]
MNSRVEPVIRNTTGVEIGPGYLCGLAMERLGTEVLHGITISICEEAKIGRVIVRMANVIHFTEGIEDALGKMVPVLFTALARSQLPGDCYVLASIFISHLNEYLCSPSAAILTSLQYSIITTRFCRIIEEVHDVQRLSHEDLIVIKNYFKFWMMSIYGTLLDIALDVLQTKIDSFACADSSRYIAYKCIINELDGLFKDGTLLAENIDRMNIIASIGVKMLHLRFFDESYKV